MENETKYTETEIRDMQEKAEKFIETINAYINLRGAAGDSSFAGCPNVDLDDPDANFYLFRDNIIIQWRESDRCGDYDYLQVEFPLADLWDPPAFQEIKKQEEQKKEQARLAAEQKKRQEEEQALKRQEESERATLKKLQQKYGAV